ncbi:bifunctional DNA primase/polymerase [Streptomyces sp. DSM 44917]|uniref:Bifunctional DNA primase/polymerase n=1 Tax=Streptomyces boetiae TaxID=3075541 RepID=A0ABU2L4B0_9ACTN|nr:bifunctional DNA primase/polymerase [Streptomyces sp. DSM 44917]MDT0306202.1 bifunctional DNA primase/polymerase [Streptomyces sp. DSM 44917]
MERESRFPRWLRRGARGAAAGAAAARAREELLLAAAGAGFPLAPAAHPQGYRCSCERIGCPSPARHPVSLAWQTQATTDRDQILRWLRADPEANFVTATGRAHDVLDVPASAGYAALDRLTAQGVEIGPVAVTDPDRMLFFTATRGTPDDEDEWWPCELDCHPETMDEHPGLRWHCRGSYVLLPPSRVMGSETAGTAAGVRWLRGPEHPLPEPLSLLESLTDACAQTARLEAETEPAAWPAG